MVEWGFISGSQYNLSLFDGTSIKNNSTEDITFTLSDLSPGQKYLICVTLITADTDSWPPWPSCKNFMTKQGMYVWYLIVKINTLTLKHLTIYKMWYYIHTLNYCIAQKYVMSQFTHSLLKCSIYLTQLALSDYQGIKYLSVSCSVEVTW